MTCQLELVLLANHVSLNSEQRLGVTVTEDQVSNGWVLYKCVQTFFASSKYFYNTFTVQ